MTTPITWKDGKAISPLSVEACTVDFSNNEHSTANSDCIMGVVIEDCNRQDVERDNTD